MARQGEAMTMASHFYDLLSNDIANGLWRPGLRLMPGELSTHYGTSTTVVREVLVRLGVERLVVSIPGKGFFVPSLTLTELKDLTLVRTHNDVLALQLAIERGGMDWETDVMTKHHILARTERRSADDHLHLRQEWSLAHRDFHASLVAGSNVPVLMDLSRMMFDSTELYRRWAAPTPASFKRDVPYEHALIMQAAIDRDAELASELLTAHYDRSLEVMLASGFVEIPEDC